MLMRWAVKVDYSWEATVTKANEPDNKQTTEKTSGVTTTITVLTTHHSQNESSNPAGGEREG